METQCELQDNEASETDCWSSLQRHGLTGGVDRAPAGGPATLHRPLFQPRFPPSVQAHPPTQSVVMEAHCVGGARFQGAVENEIDVVPVLR